MIWAATAEMQIRFSPLKIMSTMPLAILHIIAVFLVTLSVHSCLNFLLFQQKITLKILAHLQYHRQQSSYF